MTVRMPSINQLTGLPNELFGYPPEGMHHVKEIVKRFWEIQMVLEKANAALEIWQSSVAVQALPQYIATVHDDNDHARLTIECYGSIEIDSDGALVMVPESEEGEQWQSEGL